MHGVSVGWAAVVVADEVRAALDRGRPVVALESTIIAHGLPRPRNLEVAREIEGVVRERGAVPATIAVLGGEVGSASTTRRLSGLRPRTTSPSAACAISRR